MVCLLCGTVPWTRKCKIKYISQNQTIVARNATPMRWSRSCVNIKHEIILKFYFVKNNMRTVFVQVIRINSKQRNRLWYHVYLLVIFFPFAWFRRFRFNNLYILWSDCFPSKNNFPMKTHFDERSTDKRKLVALRSFKILYFPTFYVLQTRKKNITFIWELRSIWIRFF